MKRIFISYAHTDETWKELLVKHLRVLEPEGVFQAWDDRKIASGSDWEKDIQTELDAADAAVLMISADFLTSPFILNREVPRLLERRREDGLPVIPVIIKACAWKRVSWLSSMQALPKDGQPLASGSDSEMDEKLTRFAEYVFDLMSGKPTTETGAETAGGTLLLTHLPLRHHFKLIGRETDLDTLEKRIDTTQLVLLVNGLGGVGKTEVCKRFFLDHYRDYEAAAWVDYVGGLEVSLVHAVDWESRAVQRGLDARPREDTPDERFKKIARFLRDSGKTTLLVVDNIGDADDPGLDLLRRLPDNVKVLVTSRLEIPEFEAHRLDVLDEAECLELFYGIYGGERDDPAVSAVTARCGRHTLTVELLARTARNAGHTPGELLDTLETKGFHLDEGIRTFWHEQKGYKPLFRHLETIFQLSGVTEAEQFILANLSVLPPVYMPTADIRDWLGLETGTDITGLVDKGWLRRDELKIYMHPVVREVIRFKTHPDSVMCKKLIVSLARKLKVEPGDNPLSREGYVIFAASLTACLDDNDENLASLANNLGEIYRHLGRLEDALEAKLRAVKIFEQVLDKNHPDLAQSYNNLSLTYKAQGRLEEALEAQLKAQKIWEPVLDKNHPHLATYYNNFSLIYKGLGRLDEALEAQVKALSIKEQVLDKNHPDLALSYNNLSAIFHAQGLLDEALETQVKTVKIKERVLDKNHPDLATSYNNLSLIYLDLGRLDEALEAQVKTVKIFVQVLDKNHPDLAGSFDNLSTIFHAQGLLDEALEVQLKALSIREQVLDKNHPDLAFSYNNLATIYKDLKDYSAAETYAQKAVAILQTLFPGGHPDLDLAKRNLERIRKDKR